MKYQEVSWDKKRRVKILLQFCSFFFFFYFGSHLLNFRSSAWYFCCFDAFVTWTHVARTSPAHAQTSCHQVMAGVNPDSEPWRGESLKTVSSRLQFDFISTRCAGLPWQPLDAFTCCHHFPISSDNKVVRPVCSAV